MRRQWILVDLLHTISVEADSDAAHGAGGCPRLISRELSAIGIGEAIISVYACVQGLHRSYILGRTTSWTCPSPSRLDFPQGEHFLSADSRRAHAPLGHGHPAVAISTGYTPGHFAAIDLEGEESDGASRFSNSR